MVALIHNHSPGLKLWRVVGVVLMLTQSGCDVKDNRIKKRDRAAPAVVTPSTPIAAAQSAAKGAFERVDDSE